jgi:hypothetical protein
MTEEPVGGGDPVDEPPAAAPSGSEPVRDPEPEPVPAGGALPEHAADDDPHLSPEQLARTPNPWVLLAIVVVAIAVAIAIGVGW